MTRGIIRDFGEELRAWEQGSITRVCPRSMFDYPRYRSLRYTTRFLHDEMSVDAPDIQRSGFCAMAKQWYHDLPA